nr:hypothetical protein [Tanacetum cinerariifolium]
MAIVVTWKLKLIAIVLTGIKTQRAFNKQVLGATKSDYQFSDFIMIRNQRRIFVACVSRFKNFGAFKIICSNYNFCYGF